MLKMRAMLQSNMWNGFFIIFLSNEQKWWKEKCKNYREATNNKKKLYCNNYNKCLKMKYWWTNHISIECKQYIHINVCFFVASCSVRGWERIKMIMSIKRNRKLK